MSKILVCAMVVFCVGCATTSTFVPKDGASVFLDPSGCWANGQNFKTDLRSLTLKVVNKRLVAVNVLVSCRFDTGDTFSNSEVFGERKVQVEANDYSSFTIRGFQKGHKLGSRVGCEIVSVSP